jgi:hypothetical protein
MAEQATDARVAWQPLTPQGIAAFAEAPAGRLLLVQSAFAAAAALVVVWFLHTAWFSVIGAAVRQLPEQGELQGGKLNWVGASPAVLAEGPMLAVTVDLDHEGTVRSPAHIQLEWGRNDVRVISILGYVPLPYRADWNLAFNRTALIPWWGAWAPAFLGLAALGTVAGLLLTWALLASLYCIPVWVVGLYADRQLGFGASWRLAGAALMPGALLMTAAIVCYGMGGMDLVKLAAAVAGHFILGWVYVVVGPVACPRRVREQPETNPFHEKSDESDRSDKGSTTKGESGH